MDKSKKEPPGYWQHRGNGYNYHLGYNEGKVNVLPQLSGIKEIYIDRNIKEAQSLNK